MNQEIFTSSLLGQSRSLPSPSNQNLAANLIFIKEGLLTSQMKKKRALRIEPLSSIIKSRKQSKKLNDNLALASPQSVLTPLSIQGYQGKSKYTLGAINSIVINNNLIYNLFDPQPGIFKTVQKCRCFQSKCQARYCECFAKGMPCGIQCGCTNCQNVIGNESFILEKPTVKGCNCKKSNCQKKYCQCHKEGKNCSSLCQCQDCHNI